MDDRRLGTALGAKLPDDGHHVRAALADPGAPIAALSFTTVRRLAHGGTPLAGRRRARHAVATLAGLADPGQSSVRRS